MAAAAPPGDGVTDSAGPSASKVDPLRQEILRLRVANQAASKENSKMRAEAADKAFDVEQLDKQIRKLERRIEALEDVGSKKETMARGFFKPMPADYECPPVERKPPEKQKPKPWERTLKGGAGIIIDSTTGEEVDPRQYWPEETDKDSNETNILLKKADQSAEAKLMREMQNPIEVNPEFNTAKYGELLASGKREEAEDLIKTEGGPSVAQMQRKPLEVLRNHLDLNPNWRDPNFNDCSLLQWACSMGYDEVAMCLLERRADANSKTKNGMSCLAGACSKNWIDCAKKLLEHDADPNEVVEPDGGQTVLMWASRIEYCDKDGHERMNPFVPMLLEHRADVDTTDKKGKTALIHASTEGNVPVVEALLAARCDVDAQDIEGSTAMQIALRYYHGKISSLLLPLRRKLPRGEDVVGDRPAVEITAADRG